MRTRLLAAVSAVVSMSVGGSGGSEEGERRVRTDLASGEGRGVPRVTWLLSALCLCAASATAARAQPASRPAERAIRERRESSNQAIARHDTAGIAAILAPDVVVVTSNSVKASGRDANAQRFAEQFRSRPDVVYRRTPSEVAVFEPWRMASERGRWAGSWTDPDGKIEIGGSYFAKWRMIGGAWFVESETYVPERCTGGKYCSTAP